MENRQNSSPLETKKLTPSQINEAQLMGVHLAALVMVGIIGTIALTDSYMDKARELGSYTKANSYYSTIIKTNLENMKGMGYPR